MDARDGPEEQAGPEEHDPGRIRVDDPEGSGSPARPAPPSPGRRPLRRRANDKMVAGVAGGLADHFGISALGLRLVFGFCAFVVAFLLLRPWLGLQYGGAYYDPNLTSLRELVKAGSGIAVLTYFALWVFVPREDAGVSAAGRLRHRVRLPRLQRIRPWLGMLALTVGAGLIGSQIGLWSPDVTWAFLLIGVGVLVFRLDAERAGGGARTVAGGPAIAAGTAGPSASPSGWPASPAPGETMTTAFEPFPPRERSPLGWLVLGIALLVVGGAAIVQNLGGLHLRLVRFPALALVILGAGMLVGAFAGRARWLVLPALVLAPVVLVASLIHVPLVGGIHDLYVTPSSAGAVHDAYRVMAGTVYLDLSGLRGSNAERTITASTGFGQITVVVPFDAHVVATGRTGAGVVTIGPSSSGTRIEASVHRAWEPKYGDGPTFTLDLQTGIGDIEVYRNAPTKKQLRELKAA